MLLFIIWSIFIYPSRDGDVAETIFGSRHCKPIFVKIIFKAKDSIVTMAVKNESYLLYRSSLLYGQVGINVFGFDRRLLPS